MGMCVQKIKIILLLAVVAFLCGCGPMDSILPSTGTYKINININDVTLNDLSFFHSSDKLRPFFEESVSDDPDVTALVVFLRNYRGNTVGWKVTYLIEQTATEKRDESDNLSPDPLSPQGSTQSNAQSGAQDNTQSGAQDNTQSGSTPSNTQSGSTPSNTQSGSTPSSTQSGSTQSNTPSSTQSGSTPSNTQSGSTPSSTQSGSTSSNTQSGSTPSNTQSGSTPSNTQSGSTSSNTQSSSTPSNTQSGSTPSSTQSGSTPSNTQSGSTPSNTQSGSTPSNTQSGSTSSNTQSGSTSSNTQSSSTSSNTQSGSTSSSTQSGSTPSSTQSGSTPSNTQSGSTSSSTQSGSTSSNTQSSSTQSNTQSGSTPSSTQSGSTPSNTQSGSTPSRGSSQVGLLEDTETEEGATEDKLLSDEEVLAAVGIENENVLNSYKDGDEFIIVVKSLDGELPVFPIPNDLPVGRYTLVSHVMSGRDILQKIEKGVYYMGKTVFSYDGIQVHMPGIAESTQVIPKGMVVMLETVLDFDSRLNPYIIWYNGRRKIGEGYFSDGAGYLLWKAPEQSGFFYLRAEVFPVDNHNGLSGYQKDISLLVSSKAIDVNFISEDIPQLLHWYTFEGNLNDSKMASPVEWALKTDAKNKPKWAGANGTYGLLVGSQDVFSFPNVLITNDGTEIWQMLFRFNPLNDGVILSVRFVNYSDIFMNLKVEDQNLVLELVSPTEIFSQSHALPEEDSFIKAGVVFSILPEMLSAKINIMGDYLINSEVDLEQAGIAAEIEGEFQILLGNKPESNGETEAVKKREFTAIWDEFALYFMPPQEIFNEYIIEEAEEEPEQDDELLED
jgi:hypothetical protein